MIDFVLAPANMPFAVALCVVIIVAAIEGVGTLLGAGVSHLLDQFIPDVNLDWHLPNDFQAISAFDKALIWMRVGQVPVLVILLTFLLSFSLIGLSIQSAVLTLFGVMLPTLPACILALFACLPVNRLFMSGMAKIIPKDETSAVSLDSLIGRVATVSLGTARQNQAAQAKVRDQFGKTHYIMIAPDNDDEILKALTHVLLVRRESGLFFAITSATESLDDKTYRMDAIH